MIGADLHDSPSLQQAAGRRRPQFPEVYNASDVGRYWDSLRRIRERFRFSLLTQCSGARTVVRALDIIGILDASLRSLVSGLLKPAADKAG
jgi:hypothetical protein